jgi:hypothetical protein
MLRERRAGVEGRVVRAGEEDRTTKDTKGTKVFPLMAVGSVV